MENEKWTCDAEGFVALLADLIKETDLEGAPIVVKDEDANIYKIVKIDGYKPGNSGNMENGLIIFSVDHFANGLDEIRSPKEVLP